MGPQTFQPNMTDVDRTHDSAHLPDRDAIPSSVFRAIKRAVCAPHQRVDVAFGRLTCHHANAHCECNRLRPPHVLGFLLLTAPAQCIGDAERERRVRARQRSDELLATSTRE